MRLGRAGKRNLAILIAAILLAMGALAFVVARMGERAEPPLLGATFSSAYAEELGLDWREAYHAVLDDLGVRRLRIPVYWSRVEARKGEFDWSEIDWMLDEARERGAEVTLAIGAKVPRWPECFIPDWAEGFDSPKRHEETLRFMEAAVVRYREHEAVARWQIENEPLFPFGICPKASVQQLEREIRLVRDLDGRPLQVTVSGELEAWYDLAGMADVLGISLYRVTWNDIFGYFYYPVPPSFYRARAGAVSPFVNEVVISELQAEPWFPEPISSRPASEWYEAFTVDDLDRNVDFAARTGISEAYLWGVEWWAFLRESEDDRLWERGRELFAADRARQD